MNQLTKPKIDLSVIPLFIYLLLVVINNVVDPRWLVTGWNSQLSWDVLGYYLYLPSAFIYQDFFDLAYIPGIMETYEPSSYFYQAHKAVGCDNYTMTYTMGLAILLIPFFFLGHLLAFLGGFPMDGFSSPYVFAAYLGGVCYAFVGLWYLRKVLRHYFSDQIVALSLSILVVGTNFYHYSNHEVLMTHLPLFMLNAILIYNTHKWHEQHRWKYVFGIAISLGLAVLMRPSEILAALVPLLWQVYSLESLRQKVQLVVKQKWQLLALVGICFLIGLPQFLYWKWTTGQFFYYSYREVGFRFHDPYLEEGLFSIRKGWLVYTPLMALSLLGLWPLWKQHRKIALACIAYTILHIYFVFSFEVWWYGGSFGCRVLVQSYALFCFAIAAFLSLSIWRNHFAKIILGLAIVACTLLNQFQNWQYNQYFFSTEGMSPYVYKLIFGQTEQTRDMVRRFENVESFGEQEIASEKEIIFSDFEVDSTSQQVWHYTTLRAASGQQSVQVEQTHPYLQFFEGSVEALSMPEKAAFRIQLKSNFDEYEWDYYRFAKVVISFAKADGTIIYENYVPIQNLSGPEEIENPNYLYGLPKAWFEITFDKKIEQHKLAPTDRVKIFVMNLGNKAVYIDDFKISLLELK